jgi:hypothetical protein
LDGWICEHCAKDTKKLAAIECDRCNDVFEDDGSDIMLCADHGDEYTENGREWLKERHGQVDDVCEKCNAKLCTMRSCGNCKAPEEVKRARAAIRIAAVLKGYVVRANFILLRREAEANAKQKAEAKAKWELAEQRAILEDMAGIEAFLPTLKSVVLNATMCAVVDGFLASHRKNTHARQPGDTSKQPKKAKKALKQTILSKGVDVRADLCAQLDAGDPLVIAVLAKMYPATERKLKCAFCGENFFEGRGSCCEVEHDVEWTDYEREFVGRGDRGGTHSGRCSRCGEDVSAFGDEDGSELEPGTCYKGPHTSDKFALKRLRIEKLGQKEYDSYYGDDDAL